MTVPVARAAASKAGVGAARGSAARAGAAGSSSRAARDRAAIEGIKAARPQEPAAAATPSLSSRSDRSTSNSRSEPPAFLTDQRGAPGWFRTDTVKVANTGGGFALGMLAYVLGLQYLRGGSAEVKAWLRAKFLNKVGPA